MSDITQENVLDIGKHIDAAIRLCFETMHPASQVNRDLLRLYIPEPFILHLTEYYNQFTGDKTRLKITTYNGVMVLPGYELKVVLAHSSASLINDHDGYKYRVEVLL